MAKNTSTSSPAPEVTETDPPAPTVRDNPVDNLPPPAPTVRDNPVDNLPPPAPEDTGLPVARPDTYAEIDAKVIRYQSLKAQIMGQVTAGLLAGRGCLQDYMDADDYRRQMIDKAEKTALDIMARCDF